MTRDEMRVALFPYAMSRMSDQHWDLHDIADAVDSLVERWKPARAAKRDVKGRFKAASPDMTVSTFDYVPEEPVLNSENGWAP